MRLRSGFVSSFGRMFVVLFIVTACLYCAVAIAAQASSDVRTVIGEGTLFSWQAVIFLLVNVGGWAANYALVKQHMTRTDIHITLMDVETKHRTRKECELQHAKDGE